MKLVDCRHLRDLISLVIAHCKVKDIDPDISVETGTFYVKITINLSLSK